MNKEKEKEKEDSSHTEVTAAVKKIQQAFRSRGSSSNKTQSKQSNVRVVCRVRSAQGLF